MNASATSVDLRFRPAFGRPRIKDAYNVDKIEPSKYENLASRGARKLNDKQIAECSPFFFILQVRNFVVCLGRKC